jgi:hypothetical protein
MKSELLSDDVSVNSDTQVSELNAGYDECVALCMRKQSKWTMLDPI